MKREMGRSADDRRRERPRCLRGLTRVSKQININIRLKDLRVAVCPTGREIEGLPFAVLSKDSAGLRS